MSASNKHPYKWFKGIRKAAFPYTERSSISLYYFGRKKSEN
jgi:hypothetical protein